MTDAFITLDQTNELRALCDKNGDEYYERYFSLRDIVRDHKEAMSALVYDVTLVACQRITRAGGTTQEFVDLIELFDDADKDANLGALDDYVYFRCTKSFPVEGAVGRVCAKYDVNEARFSPVKQR